MKSGKGQNAVGEQVRQRRKELGLTMEQLCAAIEEATNSAWNPDRRDIYRIQEATRKITDLELVALSRSLRVLPSDLLPADVVIHHRDPEQPRIVPRRQK